MPTHQEVIEQFAQENGALRDRVRKLEKALIETREAIAPIASIVLRKGPRPDYVHMVPCDVIGRVKEVYAALPAPPALPGPAEGAESTPA